MLKKGLIFGIVILFLGMSIMPLAQSISIGKEQLVMSKSCLDGIYLNGTMGENGWYVSDVVVTLDYPGCDIYYKTDSSEYLEYICAFIVSGDGMHTVEWYYVYEGEIIGPFVVSFKIDATPPIIISLTVTAQNLLRTKWLLNAVVEDATSGVVLVEFYVDDTFVGNVTSEPYEWTWTGSGNQIVTATAFDCAGNSASSSISTPYIHSQNILGAQQINQLIHNLILRHQTIN